MCGILGGSRTGWNYSAGIEAMKHRGPDAQDILTEQQFSMAFARLSIIDLSDAAMQPMTSEDGTVTIVYNGEIYGYNELKKKLSRKYRFRSASDTEVILYAYMEYGDKFTECIDGIFAIAVYDRRDQTVHLFRDRVGVKPLYYFYNGHDFAFASELKGIKSLLGQQKLQIDSTALYDYLTYGYIPAPKSMYCQVRQLRPAHKILYSIRNHKLSSQKRYWKLKACSDVGRTKKDTVLAEELREILHKTVQEQMVSDVPVGTFLSGGADSSVITFESLSVKTDIESFSIGFEDKRYDESRYYREFAKTFQNYLREHTFDKSIFHDLYGKLRDWFDEPFADTSAFPTYLVSKLAKEKVTVVLTGDGGDELFGGYGWYQIPFHAGVLKDSPQISRLYENLLIHNRFLYNTKVNDFLAEFLQKFCFYHGYTLKQSKSYAAKRWGIPKDYDDYWFLREHDCRELPFRTRLQVLDLQTYLPGILTKVDRTSMQVSLEARVPFLAKSIIEFVFSLSQEERCPNGEMKHLLRKAYPEIPSSIMYRRKQGFSIPPQYMGVSDMPNKKILQKIWKIK